MNVDAQIDSDNRATYDALASRLAKPGMTRSHIDDLISKALGGYPHWRLKAIRLSQSGCFSAGAVLTFRQAAKKFIDQHAARAAAAAATEQTRQAALSREHLLRLRAQHAAELRKLDARLRILDGAKP